MSRIRTSKPDIAQSEALAEIPRAALYTWVSLWPQCDDYGHHLADPRLVWAALYPLRTDTTAEDVAADLQILEDGAKICRYIGCDGKAYLHVLGWAEHQRIDNASKTRIPPCSFHQAERECPLHTEGCGGSQRLGAVRGDSRRLAATRGLEGRPRTVDLGPRTVLVAPTGATTLPEVIPQALQDHEVGAGSTQGPEVRVKRGPIRGEIVRGPTAGDLVGAFVDACAGIGVEPIPRDKARVGRDCKELLAAGKSPELISAALERMVNRSRPVSALIGLVGEIERERAGHPLSRAAQNGKGDLVEITEKLRRQDGDGGGTGEALGGLPGLVAGGYVAQHGSRAGGVADDAWGREPGRGG